MAYSFIETPSKTPLTSGVKKVWFGGIILLALSVAAALFIHMYNLDTQVSIAEEKRMQKTLLLQSEQLARRQAQFETDRLFQLQASTFNQLFADQVFDLLDLIPDDATLTRVQIDDRGLIYEGVCRDYKALRTGLERAFSGQYRLVEARQEPDEGLVRFTLKFGPNGVML